MYPAGTVSILFLSALGLSLESSESLYVAGFGFWGVLCRAEASGGPRALLYVIVTYVCRHRLSVSVGLQREVAGSSGLFFRSSICGVICNLVATVLLKSKKNDLSMHKDLMGRLNKLAVPEKRPRYRNATFVLVCFLLLLNDALIAFHFSTPLSTFLHRSFQAKQNQ